MNEIINNKEIKDKDTTTTTTALLYEEEDNDIKIEDNENYKNEYDVLYGCNGCGCQIELIKNEERWICNECPDFDLCGNCYRNEMKLINGTKEEIEQLLNGDKSLGIKPYEPVKHTDLISPLPHLITLEPLSQIQLVKYLYGKSTFETMSRVFKYYSDRYCLGYRELTSSEGTLSNQFTWFTYKQIYIQTIRFARALTKFIKRRDFISIYMDNCLEWYLSDFASLWCALVVVPLHHSSSKSNLLEILLNSDSTCIVCSKSTFKHLIELYDDETIAQEVKDNIKIKLIVHKEDNYDKSLLEKLPPTIEFKTFNEMLEIGKSMKCANYKFEAIGPNDLSTVQYTSGSTGTPKGVMEIDSVSNKLLICYSQFPNTILSFHPLSHSQRLSDWRYLFMGSKIAIYSGSMNTLFNDLALVRPNIFWATPRFFNLLYTQFKSNLKRLLIEKPEMNETEARCKCLDEIKSLLGDRVTSIYTGSAPTSTEVMKFINECWIGTNFYNSYGLTEVCGVFVDGNICADVEIKIEPVISLGYSPNDKPNPRGELYVKTPSMSTGYYKNEKLTNESFIDGWFKTGDIVELIGNRKIKIIDRIKNAFKLANGEFVAPESLETNFSGSLLIDQIFIYGDSLKTFLVAIVKPSNYCLNQLGLLSNSSDDIIENSNLKSKLLNEINLISIEKNLANYEIPKIISIDFTEWTESNNLITGSRKFNRSELFKFYKDKINSMFEIVDKIQENLRNHHIETNNNNEQMFENYIKLILNINDDGDVNGDSNNNKLNLDNLSFIQIGGDSLGAIKLSTFLKENQNLDISPSILLNQNFKLSNLSNLIKDKKDNNNNGDLSNILNENEFKIDWDQEMKLDDDIIESIKSVLSSSSSSSSSNDSDDNDNIVKSIFITGVTGYLGRYLLLNLLECENAEKIYCLIRNVQNEDDGFKIIEKLLNSTGRLNDAIIEKIREKVIPVIGDLSKPLFGVSNETFNMLSNSIDMVIHNGAMVNMAYPYINMKSINVTSTRDILRLCTTTNSNNNLKRLVYVSTIGVFFGNNQNDGEEEGSNGIDELTLPSISSLNNSNGYDQSKLISEIIVRKAASYGLPTMIFRPGTIFSDSKTGFNNENDFVGLIIKGILALKSYPIKSSYIGGSNLNLSPVDWVSSSMISLIKHKPFWSSSTSNSNTSNNEAQIFHMVNQNIISFDQLIEFIKNCLNDRSDDSMKLESVTYKEWKKQQFNSIKNPLYSASSLFNENNNYLPVGDGSNISINPKTIKFLESIKLSQCEPITNPILLNYINNLLLKK